MDKKYWLATSLLVSFSSLSGITLGSAFCPFHTNMHSEAAHLHLDADGVERLFCHVCNRQFTSADYLVKIVGIKDLKRYLEKDFTDLEIEKAYQIVKTHRGATEEELPVFTSAKEFFTQIYLGV